MRAVYESSHGIYLCLQGTAWPEAPEAGHFVSPDMSSLMSAPSAKKCNVRFLLFFSSFSAMVSVVRR